MSYKRVAVITGGVRGIGRACALKLAQNEVLVVLNYSSSKADADAAVKEIIEAGGEAYSYQCDVSDSAKVIEMIDFVNTKYGRIDILINNAGITRDGIAAAMSEDDFDTVLAVNLKGTFNCTKACLKYMLKKRYGRIINISSISGTHGNAGQSNYSASKSGIIGFTKSIAKEVARKGITVNAVTPGFIETDMTQGMDDNAKKQLSNEIPIGRLGTPEEVAYIVSMLAAEEAGYITGSVYSIDGGLGA